MDGGAPRYRGPITVRMEFWGMSYYIYTTISRSRPGFRSTRSVQQRGLECKVEAEGYAQPTVEHLTGARTIPTIPTSSARRRETYMRTYVYVYVFMHPYYIQNHTNKHTYMNTYLQYIHYIQYMHACMHACMQAGRQAGRQTNRHT